MDLKKFEAWGSQVWLQRKFVGIAWLRSRRKGKMEIQNKKWEEERLINERLNVLSTWPTGAEIDLDEATEYLKKLPDNKNSSKMLKNAQQRGKTLVTARSRVALLEEQIKLFKSLEEEGGIDILPCSIDSHTRTNRYKEAESAVEESKKQGRSMLNGFPAIYYGKKGCRQILEAAERPITARQGLVDGRLLVETTLAGGFTGIVGGPFYGYTGYSKDTP
ncbi:MAG: hypothetical protein KAJ09_10320, partial [Deltaproteobacteria bacterium]|nr:hypothetical protein [Deltaproteobacteria bacterium]